MDVPLALNDIEIRQGLKGYKRKSSTFSYLADVVDFLQYVFVRVPKVKKCFIGVTSYTFNSYIYRNK